ncbi:MAG: hypothetical protein AB1521_04720 [Bacteroidota bacterium]
MNNQKLKRERVDSLIDQLWNSGYLTLSRKYGKYLPSPSPVGNYEVDAIAKYKKKIAFGIVLNEDELNDPNLITKLEYLASAKTKYQENRITIFLGVPNHLLIKAHMITATLKEEAKEHIKIVPLPDGNKSMK